MRTMKTLIGLSSMDLQADLSLYELQVSKHTYYLLMAIYDFADLFNRRKISFYKQSKVLFMMYYLQVIFSLQ